MFTVALRISDVAPVFKLLERKETFSCGMNVRVKLLDPHLTLKV